MPMLELSDISAGYGRTEVLFNVGLKVQQGHFTTLLGRNGMGKSTLIKVLTGLLPSRSGSIAFDGKVLNRMKAYQIARLGIGLVPEGRMVCPNLTVRENLVATERPSTVSSGERWTLDRVYSLFPRLKERSKNLGFQLSGGEQQLLAIGRALMTNPRLLILDEATEGLAPLIREQVWECLHTLRNEGLSVLLIDKNIDILSQIADHHYVIEKGTIVWHGSNNEFIEKRPALEEYLGV